MFLISIFVVFYIWEAKLNKIHYTTLLQKFGAGIYFFSWKKLIFRSIEWILDE